METYQKAIEAAKEQVKSGKIKKPQKKRVESMNMPYLELKMTSGTICDLNGLPRMARIQYVCYPSGIFTVRIVIALKIIELTR